MKNQNTWLNQLFVTLYRLPGVKEFWGHIFKTVQAEEIPWIPLTKPLSECTVALVTTGGVHLKTDTPFDMHDKRGDPSYRRIPSTVSQDDLTITHIYYDHRDADEDINLVLPLDVLRQCQMEGLIGPSAENFYGFMGHIEPPHVETLIDQTAKAVAQNLKQAQVDVVVLVPA